MFHTEDRDPDGVQVTACIDIPVYVTTDGDSLRETMGNLLEMPTLTLEQARENIRKAGF